MGSIPLLALAQDDAVERPAVLLFHGLHSDKDTHRRELESLAGRGWLALGVDAPGHGERAWGDLRAYLGLGDSRGQILQLVSAGLEEVPLLLDWLQLRGYRRFAALGISFGGFLTYGLAARYGERLCSLVSVVACPDWGAGSPFVPRWSPHQEREALGRARLLAWNAGRDVYVETARTRQVMDGLGGRTRYLEHPESDHFFRPQDWDEGWHQSLQWISDSFEETRLD